ncbi:hypothetical protein Strop_0631 [Salinispora tropica CNB-440]|uniref:Uncharacterized protein n=1 Tax=Salinispora tropica (strain ATCC BAA-916 / DSM 44818 / JCM 13857 / NBRC 105044 / CNB-440) TaxID=369723 RepID=A4X2L0_SALTO|nr:hypothetical protein Strop_0631 [Salinispora tropica CNB-440]
MTTDDWNAHVQQARTETAVRRRCFEVVGFEAGRLHSWRCNSLQRDAQDRLGITVNELGLLNTVEQARAAAEMANRDASGSGAVHPGRRTLCLRGCDGDLCRRHLLSWSGHGRLRCPRLCRHQ